MERAISVRLDEGAQRALRVLTRDGRSRSDAIRAALIAAARRAEPSVREEAAVLAADDGDRAEMAEVAALMEELRAPR